MPVSFSFTVAPVAAAAAPATTSATTATLALPRDFAVDADGDLLLSNGDFVFTTGLDGIADDFKTRLNTFLGECFVDTTLGMPWLTEILGHRPTPARVRELLAAQAKATPGLTGEFRRYSATQSGRTLDVAFEAVTMTGDALAVSLTLGAV